MVDLDKLERAANAASWTGHWYDAGCNTVNCDYNSKSSEGHDEICHPVSLGITEHIANCEPSAILELIAHIRALREALLWTGAAVKAMPKDERDMLERKDTGEIKSVGQILDMADAALEGK